jgi:hypothetical protein
MLNLNWNFFVEAHKKIRDKATIESEKLTETSSNSARQAQAAGHFEMRQSSILRFCKRRTNAAQLKMETINISVTV